MGIRQKIFLNFSEDTSARGGTLKKMAIAYMQKIGLNQHVVEWLSGSVFILHAKGLGFDPRPKFLFLHAKTKNFFTNNYVLSAFF